MQRGEYSSKLGRNEMEKYRRSQMKALVGSLVSLIPTQATKRLPLPALLDQATGYIQQLKDHLEELRKRREQLNGLLSPAVLSIRDVGSTLEINLIVGANNNLMLYEVLSVLQEEGAEVVSASFSTVGDRIFYSIHSQALVSRIGINISTISARLQKLVFHV